MCGHLWWNFEKCSTVWICFTHIVTPREKDRDEQALALGYTLTFIQPILLFSFAWKAQDGAFLFGATHLEMESWYYLKCIILVVSCNQFSSFQFKVRIMNVPAVFYCGDWADQILESILFGRFLIAFFHFVVTFLVGCQPRVVFLSCTVNLFGLLVNILSCHLSDGLNLLSVFFFFLKYQYVKTSGRTAHYFTVGACSSSVLCAKDWLNKGRMCQRNISISSVAGCEQSEQINWFVLLSWGEVSVLLPQSHPFY